MSSSMGKVRFKDGVIKYFRYNGTADVCNPNLYNTQEECEDNWRKEPKVDYDKEYKWEPVEIATCYGLGSTWEGFASKSGIIYHGSVHPNDIVIETDDCSGGYFGCSENIVNVTEEGLPDWWEE